MKQIIERLAGKSNLSKNSDLADSAQPAVLEVLESRMLFSAGPVDAPDDGGLEAPTADESVVSSASSETNVTSESPQLSSDGSAAPNNSLPVLAGETAINSNQAVNLVDLNTESAQLNRDTLEGAGGAQSFHFESLGSQQNLILSLDDAGNLQILDDNGVLLTRDLASISELTITGNDLDNTLQVDFANGNPIPVGGLTYDGVNRGTDFDVLDLVNATVESVTYNHENQHDGDIEFVFGDGSSSTIKFRNIEPITQAIVADAVEFNYSSASEIITISRVGADTVIDSTAGESVTILTHDLGLTINAGGGNDIININGFAPGFDAALIIDGQTGSDVINYRADGVSLGTGNSATFTAEKIDFILGDLTTSDGNITATATGGSGGNFVGVRLLGTDLTTGSGDITLTGEGGDTGSGNQGVQLASSSALLTGGGNIEIDGTGGGTGAGNHGVAIFFGSSISATGGGTLMIDGTSSTAGSTSNHGVFFAYGSSASVVNGALTIVGTGDGSIGLSNGINAIGATISSSGSGNITGTGSSGGNGSNNQGITLVNTSIDTTGGSGSITLNGTGSTTGLSNNEGIKLANTDLETGGNGSIDISGQGGGNGAGSNNTGVALSSGSTVKAPGGLTIDGDAGDGKYFNRGVYLTGGSSVVSSFTGSVAINGTGRGSSGFNRGIEAVGSEIRSIGSGSVTLKGTGSQSSSGLFNTGVYLASSTVRAVSVSTGNITIHGTGGSGSSYNEGVRILSSSVSTNGRLEILGTAKTGTTGSANSGVYIHLNNQIHGSYSSSIRGTGGGGYAFNHGVVIQGGITLIFGDGTIPACDQIVGSAGAGNSEDEFGSFFPCLSLGGGGGFPI